MRNKREIEENSLLALKQELLSLLKTSKETNAEKELEIKILELEIAIKEGK